MIYFSWNGNSPRLETQRLGWNAIVSWRRFELWVLLDKDMAKAFVGVWNRGMKEGGQ